MGDNIFRQSYYRDIIYIFGRNTPFIRVFKKIFNFKNSFSIRKYLLIFDNYFFFFSLIIPLYISNIFLLTFIPSIKIRFSTNNFSWVKFIYIISLIFFNFIFAFYLIKFLLSNFLKDHKIKKAFL